jgi:hypothetical protein
MSPTPTQVSTRVTPDKAAVIYENGGPDVLCYEDVPDPECLDGCVVIDVEAISIEGGDLLARAGSPPSAGCRIGFLRCELAIAAPTQRQPRVGTAARRGGRVRARWCAGGYWKLEFRSGVWVRSTSSR